MRRSALRTFQPVAPDRLSLLTGSPLAGFWSRAAAFAIDSVFVIVVAFIGEFLLHLNEILHHVGNVTFEVNPYHGRDMLALVLYYAPALYWGHGRTLGKRLMHIRVVSLTHEHLSFWHGLERTLGYGASVLEGGFGFIQFFIHPNRQTVHDRIAETIVIKVPRKPRETLEKEGV